MVPTKRITNMADNAHMVRPIRISNTCQARGLANKGASHRAPKPKAQNHSKLALPTQADPTPKPQELRTKN